MTFLSACSTHKNACIIEYTDMNVKFAINESFECCSLKNLYHASFRLMKDIRLR